MVHFNNSGHKELLLGDVMTPFTISVMLQTPISQASAFMHEKNVHHLPVTDNEALVGVLSSRDIQILKAVFTTSVMEKVLK